MGFGFDASQYAAPDYATRGVAGMPLDPNAPDQSVMPALQVQAPPQAAPPPSQGLTPYEPSFGDIALRMLFDQQGPAEAAAAARAANYTAQKERYGVQQQQMLMDALQNAPPEQRLPMLLNAGETGKALADRLATHTLKGGETLVNGGPGGAPVTAPLLGFDDKSGGGYSVGPGGTISTDGHSLGGDYDISSLGPVISKRTGPTGQIVSLPQNIGPGYTGLPFSATISGGPNSPTTPAATPQTAQPAISANAPRGIRNNNFGNVRALPNGAQWPGQAGVDPDGYAIFSSPTAGAQAAKQNLQAYAKQGINTITGIVTTWAPKGDGKNDPVAYAHYLAGKLGVDPNQPLNMSDTNVQKGILRGIFDFENGPAAMAAWNQSHAPQQGGNGSAAAPAAQPGSGFGTPFAQGKVPTPMTADQRKQWGISSNDPSSYAMGPDGRPFKSAEAFFGPSQQLAYTAQVTGTEPYKNYSLGRGYLATMQTLIKQPGGFADLGLIENAGKTVNPTVAIRPNMIEQYSKEVGWPDWLQGEISSVVNHGGHLTQQGRNALLNIAQANVQSHWDQLQPIIKKVDHDASRYGVQREDLIPDLVPMPGAPGPSYPGAGIPGKPQPAVQPVPVKTPQEAMRLPPGTPILLPDGRRGVVPAHGAQQ